MLPGTETKGIFRIPGSAKVINEIYDYYCPSTQDEADKIDTTVSSPNLPTHFKASVHDVASTFKRFLAGLPGGILGSLSLFDALVAIHSQLQSDPEFTRTKQSKLRARLIALAIGTLKSQYRRELICAVFGLLSLIGRTAERAQREDEWGRPLPTSELMGYNALGVVFGPLLVGDMLDSYSMRLAHPDSGLVLLPLSPPKGRRERRRSRATEDPDPTASEVDKIEVANHIAEMVITHWREVVRHIKNLEASRRHGEDLATDQSRRSTNVLRPSASETFANRQQSQGWGQNRSRSVNIDTTGSPMPQAQSFKQPKYPEFVRGLSHVLSHPDPYGVQQTTERDHEPLVVKRKRPSTSHLTPNNRLAGKTSHPVLSPTVEESPVRKASNPLSPTAEEPAAVGSQVYHDPAHRGSIHHTPTRQRSVEGGQIIHSPVPRSPVHRSPILRSSSHDLMGLEQSLPLVEFAAAMREPRGSHPGSIHISDRKRSTGSRTPRGSHNRGRGRGSSSRNAAAGVSGSGSRDRSSSPSTPVDATPSKWKEGYSHPGESHGASSPSKSVMSTIQGHRNSVPLQTPTQSTSVGNNNNNIGRTRSDISFDSGYFPDNEQGTFPHPVQHAEDGRKDKDAGLQTPAILGAFPESSTPYRRALEGSLVETEKGAMHEVSNDLTRQPSQAAVSSTGAENRPSGEQVRDAPPTETQQVPGSFPRQSSWLSRISSSRSATERHPSGPASPVVAEEAPAIDDTSRQVSASTPNVTGNTESDTKGNTPSVSGPFSGVKAMAAMFETVWNDPSTLRAPSRLLHPLKGSRSMGNASTPFIPNETPRNRSTVGRSSSVASRVSGYERPGSIKAHDEDIQPKSRLSPSRQSQTLSLRTNRKLARSSSARTISISETGLRPVSKPATPQPTTTAPDLTHEADRPRPLSKPSTPQPSITVPDVAHEVDPEVAYHQRMRMLTPGRMTPGIEQPPIARHLSHRIPGRSATPSSLDNDSPLELDQTPAQTPLPTPGGTAALHAQVRHLQRQLAAKTEEAVQLRRQIEAMEGGNGVGTVSERLRASEREARMWKDRALTAERRVAVFEKFLGRVRQLRESEKEKGRELYGGEVNDVLVGLESEVGGDGQRSSERTEDGAIFDERIRKRLMAMDGASEEELDVYDEDEEANCLREMARETELEGAFSTSLLAAAREVLEYEDMRTWLNGTS